LYSIACQSSLSDKDLLNLSTKSTFTYTTLILKSQCRIEKLCSLRKNFAKIMSKMNNHIDYIEFPDFSCGKRFRFQGPTGNNIAVWSEGTDGLVEQAK
jgi:hypothetical protein